MDTYDQMIVDNRYPSDFDDDKYLFSKQQISNKDDDGNGSLGRRVYLESPSFGNKEEEDMYRYVPSRLTDRTASIIGGNTLPARTGATLMDTLDFELDVLGTNNTRPEIPYRQMPKPVAPIRQLSNMPRSDPRQDPLLGPLLAELDAMSNQQQLPSSSPPVYQQHSVPYQSNLVRPVGSSSSNHALTNIANRTVNDALLQADLYDSLEPKHQQQQQRRLTLPLSTQNLNSLNNSRPPNMTGTDIFMPSTYNTDPGTFLSHFGPEDQLFQRPLLNTLGQNYVPNLRPPPPPPPQQRDTTFDQTHTRISPPQRTTYAPPNLPRNHINEQQQQPPSSNPFIEYQRAQPQQRYDEQIPRQVNQNMFFTDHNENQFEQQQQHISHRSGEQQQQQQQQQHISHRSGEQQDQDSKRQAVWNELQRTNVKVQEKNVKKHELPTRNRAPFGSSSTWNGSGSQQSSAISKSPQRHFHHPPPISKPNYVEENIDMIKNKENFYQRNPGRKYENLYSKRQDFHSGSVIDKQEQEPINHQRQSSLPVTVNLNPGENPQSGSLPGTITVPVDSHINRVGDKISVNIDLRLVDLQNIKQQQQGSDHPQWSSGDPLDRHIRKLERNIEQTLPITHPPQRSPVIPNTGVNPPLGRYGRQTTGVGRGGYNPPMYGGDAYNYSDKGREEDSYLARLNYTRKNPQFKPYTGRDYEQFKKNYGFGTGHLAYEFENTNHREKAENLAKTRQYAQQIEARNKKKITQMSRRTLSDTRLPKAPRPFEYPQSAIRQKRFSGKSTHSSPAILSEIVPFIPARRPTDVLYRQASTQKELPKLPQYENNEIIEQDEVPIKNTLKSPPKQREDRTNQRFLPPLKHLPPTGNNKRRPIRFNNEPTPRQNPRLEQTNVDQTANRDNKQNMVMEILRRELSERPLKPNEELVLVNEQ